MKGHTIHILIVEGDSPAFKKRVEIESAENGEYRDKYKDLTRGRLLAELCSAIRILYEIQETVKLKHSLRWGCVGEIKLRFRTDTPEDDEWFALTLAEDGLNGFACVRVYPKGKKRGMKGDTFFCESNDPKTEDKYHEYLKKFNELWEKGKPCDLDKYNKFIKTSCGSTQ